MKVELEPVEALYPFVLTEEQEQLRREIREFAAREIAPHVAAWDEASEFPMDAIKKLGEMGLLGVIIPAGVWRRRPGLRGLRAGHRRALGRGRVARAHRGGAQFAGHKSYFSRRQRSAEEESIFRGWRAASGWRHGRSPSPAPARMPATRAPLR